MKSIDQKSLLIAGMHRSHTSLVSEAFMNAGLFLGDYLIGANPHNAHGHFESQAIVQFHLDVLQQSKLSHWAYKIDLERAKEVSLGPDFQRDAMNLLKDKFNKPIIGWKDPRSAFFLEGWHKVLPDPHYVIVIRHPVSCINSLINRQLRNSLIKYRPYLATRYFNLWDVTNQALFDFATKYPSKCLVIHAPEDLLSHRATNQINQLISTNWAFKLDEIDFRQHYDQKLVQSDRHPRYLKWLYNQRKDTKNLFDRLCQIAEKQHFRD